MTASSQVGFTMASPSVKKRCSGELIGDYGSKYQKSVKDWHKFFQEELRKAEADAVCFISSVKHEGKKVQAELSSIRQKKILLEDQVEVLTKGNEEGDEQIKKLQEQNTTLQKKISDLESEKTSLHSLQTDARKRIADLDKIVTDLESKVREREQQLSIVEGKLKESGKANVDLSRILSRLFGGSVEHVQISTHSLDQQGHEIPQSSGSMHVEDDTDLSPAHLVFNPGRSTDQEVQCAETRNEEAGNSVAKSKPSQNAENENKRKAKNGAVPLSKKTKTVANSQPSESNGYLPSVVNETKLETDDLEVVFHRKPSDAFHTAKQIFEECLCSSDYRRNIALQKLVFENQDRKVVQCLISLVSLETRKTGLVKLPRLRLILNLVKSLLQNSDLNLEAYAPELIKSVLKWILEPNSTFFPPSEPSDWSSYWNFRTDTAPLLAALCQKSKLSEPTEEAVKTFTAVLMDPRSPLESIHGAIVGLGEFGNQIVQVQLLPRIREIGETLKSRRNSAEDSLSKVDELAIFFAEAAIEKVVGPLILSSNRAPVGIAEYKR